MIRDNGVSGRRLETGRRSESIIYIYTINLTSTFNPETGCNKICDDFDHMVYM